VAVEQVNFQCWEVHLLSVEVSRTADQVDPTKLVVQNQFQTRLQSFKLGFQSFQLDSACQSYDRSNAGSDKVRRIVKDTTVAPLFLTGW
jgi:hypothetical protein